MKAMHITTLLLSLLPLGCSVQNNTCPQSVASNGFIERKEALRKTQGLPQYIPGGWLEVEKFESLKSTKITRLYCSAFASFDDVVLNSVRIWTAQHCYRLGLVKQMTFYLYGGSGYIRIPITTEMLSNISSIRSNITISDPKLIDDTTKLLHSGDDFRLKVRTTSLQRCTEKEPGISTACFTVYDLVTFRATFTEVQSPSNLLVLNFLAASSRRFLPTESDRKLFYQYQSGIEALMVSRNVSAVNAFLNNLSKCKADKSYSPDCSDTYVSEGLSLAKSLLNVSSFHNSGFLIGRGLSQSSGYDIDSEVESWKSELTASIERFKGPLAESWATMDTDSFRRNHPIIFGTNLLTQGKFAFTWLPSQAHLVSPDDISFTDERYMELGKAGGSSRSWLFKSPKNEGGIQFSFGDSGSLLLYRGIPIAAMSHKDGDETSEGAPLMPMPDRKPAVSNSSVSVPPPQSVPASSSSALSSNPPQTDHEMTSAASPADQQKADSTKYMVGMSSKGASCY